MASAREPESETPHVGPFNRALGEIYQRLYPEIQRPKPNQEAIAAALQAMQRLTMEADSENAAEDVAAEVVEAAFVSCGVCGHQNREGNKFCGACGISLEVTPAASQAAPPPLPSPPKVDEQIANDDVKGKTRSVQPSAPSPSMPETIQEVHPGADAQAGNHHYHHHYHHHYFQSGSDAAPLPRANAPESAREADRLRVAAAAKGEHMSRGEAAVRRLTQEWILACNTRQLEELIELYAADALVLRSNLPPIRGAVAVREFFYASLESGLGEVALDPMRVEVVGDVAHEVGRYSALVPGTVGKRREERGKYLWVFARQTSGDWKLIAECWCSDLTLTAAESDVPKFVIASPSKSPARKI